MIRGTNARCGREAMRSLAATQGRGGLWAASLMVRSLAQPLRHTNEVLDVL